MVSTLNSRYKVTSALIVKVTNRPPRLTVTPVQRSAFPFSDRDIWRFYAVVISVDVLLILVTLLSGLGLPQTDRWIIQKFNLRHEANVAVWYSSVLLLGAAVAALAISRDRAPARAHRTYAVFWTLAAIAFAWLSLDETAMIHEGLGWAVIGRFGSIPFMAERERGGWIFAWTIVLFPAILAFVVGMVWASRAWLGLHRLSQRLTLIATACWAAVVITEVVESQMARLSMNRSFEWVIEEGLEITGTTLFLIAFIEFLRRPER